MLVGNQRLMIAENIDIDPLKPAIHELEEAANTVILIAVDNQLAAAIGVADTVKKALSKPSQNCTRWV